MKLRPSTEEKHQRSVLHLAGMLHSWEQDSDFIRLYQSLSVRKSESPSVFYKFSLAALTTIGIPSSILTLRANRSISEI